jgi:hypothetical protein
MKLRQLTVAINLVLKTFFSKECIGLNISRYLARLALVLLAYENIRKVDDKQLEAGNEIHGNCRFCCLIINEVKTLEEVKIQSVIEQ